ncbi:MAG: right-handed parallel beta-helix repeat-containing protein, partial [Actinobacteria bacterium]|nr:right-handed parallel beta-helix repeat-containing protein [Actinomycetota bacterium]
YKIAAGGDGNLWYTKIEGGVIGRVTPGGVFTEFYLPAGTRPQDITKAPDGNLWFTDRENNQIGRITTDGVVGLFKLAEPNGYGRTPRNITPGPDGDGRLWFTMQGPAAVGAFVPFVPEPSAPDIRSIVPPDSTTDGGTKVLITGYNIGTDTQRVLFGGTPATSFKVLGPGQIEAVAPAHAAGEVDVTIVTASGTTAPSEGSKFFYSSLACGKVITQSTTLTEDIGPCYHDGVIVRADNITLDLNNKRVYSFLRPSDGNAAGIRLPGRKGVTVKNGTVSGFDAGVVVGGGGSNTLTGLTVKDNIGPDTVTTTLGDGIFIEASASNKVVGNTISHNGIFDGIGIYEPQSNSNIVENNVIENTVGPSDRGPAGQGIIINGATEGATPTHVESVRVANNVVRDNASAGIANVNHVRGSIVGNTVTGNGATNSVGNGIGVSVG